MCGRVVGIVSDGGQGGEISFRLWNGGVTNIGWALIFSNFGALDNEPVHRLRREAEGRGGTHCRLLPDSRTPRT